MIIFLASPSFFTGDFNEQFAEVWVSQIVSVQIVSSK